MRSLPNHSDSITTSHELKGILRMLDTYNRSSKATVFIAVNGKVGCQMIG